MSKSNESILEIDLSSRDMSEFHSHYSGIVVYTFDEKILLQKRPDNWWTFPGKISTFGGKIEEAESPPEGAVRELSEELGAVLQTADLIALGAVTEAVTNHKDIVHLFFWHDEQNTIKGCYEGEAAYFANVAQAVTNQKLMDDVKWALQRCADKGYIE